MRKFLQEVVTYFWIPLIMALVSFIFFQLRDVILGIIVLIGLSAVYTLVRLYFIHKKWWLLIILVVVVFASVGAYFLRAPATSLTINDQKVAGPSLTLNSGTVTISPAPGNSGLYSKGVKVTLSASPAAGYDFQSWSGTDDDAANPTQITMEGNRRVTVSFAQRYSLVINNQLVIGSFLQFEEGSVSVSPPPDGDGKYKQDTLVTLTATAESGYDWTGWAGTSGDAANPASVAMSGNRNVTVNFARRFTLTVSNQLVIGSVVSFDEGYVTVSPAPGDDGAFANGARVTLTATPNTGYGWKNWSGTGADNANPAVITINSDKHVAVAFEARYLVSLNGQALAAASANFTGGAVTASPAPGADGRYAKNSTAVLTALPAAGYRFDKWGGDVSDRVTSISLVMNANKSLTVSFIKTWNLTANAAPAAGGAVSPASGTYDDGALVSLTAVPATGYRFGRWTGAVSDTTTTISLVMNADKTVTANFIKTWHLTAAADPPASGNVTPASGTYDTGAVVTLTALANTGFVFDHWSGAASGNLTSANVTLDADKSVTANFLPAP